MPVNSQLLGPTGRPISSKDFENKKAPAPKTGEAFGAWAGRDIQFAQLPGGGVVQFDLSKLTLSDFRAMRDHYQINASLAVLTFMQHQSDWHLEGDDKKSVDICTEQLQNMWTPLCRSLGTANWAGFSPNALNWENDVPNRTVVLDKIKDLIPEECTVNWKLVDGWAPPGHLHPKMRIYDGIKQGPFVDYDDEGRLRRRVTWPIPVENSFWYPLLMENGDYSGKKLLKPAFTSWFFSVLIHLFANRYYERFGEPTPVGRAPFDEEFPTVGDTQIQYGNVAMLGILQNLRNRGAVVLPNDRVPTGVGDASEYAYDIEYLESQMRGADFERYLTRLDEEMSLGLFTPILLFRTADVGSYNLGTGHMQMYLWLVNALNGDRKYYIDKYILRKITDFNISPSAPAPKIVYKKLGNQNAELIRAILTELVRNDKVKPNLVQLGEMAGLTLTEVEQLTSDPATDPNADPRQGRPGREVKPKEPGGPNQARAVTKDICSRVRPQIENAERDGKYGRDLQVSMGYRRKFEEALREDGITDALAVAGSVYGYMDSWISDALVALRPDEFMPRFETAINTVLDNVETVRRHA